MRRRLEAAGTFNVWPAFTDVLGGLVVVLVFLITIFVIGEVLIGRELTGKDTAIDQLARIIDGLERLVGESNEDNERLRSRLATVRNHIHNILEKLDVHSKLEAVSLAFRQGWVQGPNGELEFGSGPFTRP